MDYEYHTAMIYKIKLEKSGNILKVEPPYNTNEWVQIHFACVKIKRHQEELKFDDWVGKNPTGKQGKFASVAKLNRSYEMRVARNMKGKPVFTIYRANSPDALKHIK
jgi:hypothetical protein